MGVQLRDLVHAEEVPLEMLRGRKLALDAYNMLYQFLATIRQPGGEPFTDAQGAITSHLVGLLYRTASLLQNGVLPAYVFDGKPSGLKAATLRARALAKERAQEKWAEALARGDLALARKRAAGTSRLTPEMAEDARTLLTLLGVPTVQAPSEGEAQAAYMAKRGDVWAAASEDYDTLLFGVPRYVRGLGALRGGGREGGTTVRLLEGPRTLAELGVTQEELILIGILIGTDFNEGVPGIGPKKALKLVREHLGWEATLKKAGLDPEAVEPVRALFLDPPRTEAYELLWRRPDLDGLRSFLVSRHGFDPGRIDRVLRRLPDEAPRSVTGTQMTLQEFESSAS